MSEQRIRVMIVDDSALARKSIGDLIRAQSDMDVVGVAATGQEAVRRAAEAKPDVVLMDIHMPDLDGIQATWLLANAAPLGSVIMLTSEERIDFLQRSMAAGAQGYVLKPYDSAKLLQTIHDVHARARGRLLKLGEQPIASMPTAGDESGPPVGNGKRIAIFGAKGGVGKTSLAVSLAIRLRQEEEGRSVVLFDADFLFGGANVHLDISTELTVLDLIPYIDALDSRLIRSVVVAHSSGVHLLSRPARAEQSEVITAEHVRTILSSLAAMYSYVVIDTQPSYDERMLAVLDSADVYILVLAPDVAALRNTRHFIDVARIVGYSEHRMCFVLNRADNLAGLTFDDIANALGTRRILQIPSVGAALSRAINEGRPLIEQHPRSAFARTIGTLSERVRLIASDASDQVHAHA